ncbi:antibiotic biosynthesis monooxygenase family protein [Stakelama marina]|uniref:antibiotic biosynthesis monooxygenase family protein n=1 Tax=Stakelama marina TaxID=2826939 RepID=UPI00325FD00F
MIFTSRRTANDGVGYDRAAAQMEALAAAQPGFAGFESVRGADGVGITVSYWQDRESACAWRDHPEHSRIRQLGRDRWYRSYSITVAEVERAYDWTAP